MIRTILVTVVTLALAYAAAAAADVQTKLDQLDAREKQLLEKLEGVQQRERDLQSRLDELRKRKEYILNQQAVRKPGTHDTTPAPEPTP